MRAQRGRVQVPGTARLAPVEVLAALALRHLSPGGVAQLLTECVATSAIPPGMLAWRLGEVLTVARRDQARQVHADEDGVRYAAMLAARDNTSGPVARAAIATARGRARGDPAPPRRSLTHGRQHPPGPYPHPSEML